MALLGEMRHTERTKVPQSRGVSLQDEAERFLLDEGGKSVAAAVADAAAARKAETETTTKQKAQVG